MLTVSIIQQWISKIPFKSTQRLIRQFGPKPICLQYWPNFLSTETFSAVHRSRPDHTFTDHICPSIYVCLSVCIADKPEIYYQGTFSIFTYHSHDKISHRFSMSVCAYVCTYAMILFEQYLVHRLSIQLQSGCILNGMKYGTNLWNTALSDRTCYLCVYVCSTRLMYCFNLQRFFQVIYVKPEIFFWISRDKIVLPSGNGMIFRKMPEDTCQTIVLSSF